MEGAQQAVGVVVWVLLYMDRTLRVRVPCTAFAGAVVVFVSTIKRKERVLAEARVVDAALEVLILHSWISHRNESDC